jgi:hypothetical protein
VGFLKHFRVVAASGRICPAARSFADARGNFAVPNNFAQDNSLGFHLRNELVYLCEVDMKS